MTSTKRLLAILGLGLIVSLGSIGCSGNGGQDDAGTDGDGADGGDIDIPCTDIGDCPVHNLCLEGICREGVHCASSAECPQDYECLILKAVCVPSNPCTSNEDCDPPKPLCLEGSGVCVVCKDNEDCEAGFECNENYECRIEGPDCVDDNDCQEAGKTHCFQGQCVACGEDSHCSPQVCEPTVHQCVECYDNAHCTGANPYCLDDANTCVQCLDDNDCAGTDRCSLAHQCTDLICQNDDDCLGTPATPRCKQDTGDCVQCTAHDHCGTFAWCRDYLCLAGCETDQECVDKQGDHYHCDQDDNSCYYAVCLIDADCTATPETPHCKVAASPSNNDCVECTEDEHCDDFFYCKPGEDTCTPEPCYRTPELEAKCKEINACYECDWMSGNCEPAEECTYPDGEECCPGYTCESYGCELDLNCTAQDPVCATGYECNTQYNQCEWQSCCQPPCGAGEFCNSNCACESGCHEAGETCDPISQNCCTGLICNIFWPFCA